MSFCKKIQYKSLQVLENIQKLPFCYFLRFTSLPLSSPPEVPAEPGAGNIAVVTLPL